jgi:uncharacterized protein (DUF2225 family)
MNKKRVYESPFFIHLKKHKCLKCATNLEVLKVRKVIDPKSDEAKNYDLTFYDGGFVGDVEYIYDIFKCAKCGFTISISDMKKHERQEKKERKQKSIRNRE